MRGRTEDLTLHTVAQGRAMAEFQDALEQVVGDILDPNKEARTARTITMKFTFRPDDSRQQAASTLQTSVTRAGRKPVGDLVFFGMDREAGRPVATRYDPAQLEIGEDPGERKVVPMARQRPGT